MARSAILWPGRPEFESLLRSLFDESQLRHWVALYPHANGIDDLLPGRGISLRELVHQTTSIFLSHGLIEDFFFEHMLQTFPNRSADIVSVWQTWERHCRTGAPPCSSPIFRNRAMETANESLKQAYTRRRKLVLANQPTDHIDKEIIHIRRELRQGPQLKPGDFLHQGRFELGDVIGRGGFASVWLAYDRETNEPVAVKVLHGQESDDISVRERFERGARNTARMHHPNIVRIVRGAFIDGGYHAYVMEYVNGGDLRRRAILDRLPESQLLEVFIKTFDALEHAHRLKFIHRDIKPTNVLLDGAGIPRLTDFDLMKAHDTTGGTRSGAAIGTPCYIAPELWTDARAANERSDIYSLGMTMLACTLRQDIGFHILFNPATPLQAAAISPPLQQLILRTIEHSPDRRPSSAAEVISLLRKLTRQGLGNTTKLETTRANTSAQTNPPAPTSGVQNSSEDSSLPNPDTSSASRSADSTPTYPSVLLNGPRTTPSKSLRNYTLLRGFSLLSIASLFWISTIVIRPPSVVPVHPADLTIPIKQEPLPAFDPEAPPAIDDPPIALDPEAPPEPVAPVEPPPAAEPTAPPEPNFGYGATRKLIEEQHAFLRNECMGKPKASLTRLKFRVDVRPDGRPLARVYSGDKAVRNCVRSLFTFPLDKTPNGAAFEYSLTATSNSLKPVPVDPEKVK